MANEPEPKSANDWEASRSTADTHRDQRSELEPDLSPAQASASTVDDDFFSARTTAISRELSAYEAISRAEDEAYSAPYPLPLPSTSERLIASRDSSQPAPPNFPQQKPGGHKKRGLLWRSRSPQPEKTSSALEIPSDLSAGGQYVINPIDGSTIFVPARAQPPDQPPDQSLVPRSKAWWEKQPYSAIAYTLAISGTLTGAWLFGVLVAQVLPGSFTQPPLQEIVLRKSSRFASRLWHLPQLWRSPTTEIRIEAMPLPETGPVLAPVSLPPIQRQPLIDELNSIETEVLTLDRRTQTLEKRLGKPPYQGAGIESRVNLLRAAIDPAVLSTEPPKAEKYEPAPANPNNQLLEVAKLKITLPSDALFSPGQSKIKDTTSLNQVLDQLVNYPQATVLIRSYSDDQAEAASSREYTLAQADALSDYLRASLPSTYRWVTVGNGRSQPLDSNDSDTGRQRNRRIEILVDTRQ